MLLQGLGIEEQERYKFDYLTETQLSNLAGNATLCLSSVRLGPQGRLGVLYLHTLPSF